MTPHCYCVYKWFIHFCKQRSSLVQSGADLSIYSVGLADISHKPGFMGQGAWGKPWVSWAGKSSSSEWFWCNKRIKKTSFLCLYFYHEHHKLIDWLIEGFVIIGLLLEARRNWYCFPWTNPSPQPLELVASAEEVLKSPKCHCLSLLEKPGIPLYQYRQKVKGRELTFMNPVRLRLFKSLGRFGVNMNMNCDVVAKTNISLELLCRQSWSLFSLRK